MKLTSTGWGAVIPTLWDNGVPTEIDGDRCILFCTRLTVNMTGDLSGKRNFKQLQKITNQTVVINRQFPFRVFHDLTVSMNPQ